MNGAACLRVASTAALVALGVCCCAGTRAVAAEPVESALAARAVRLLATRCVNCHGAEKEEGDLRLDSRAALVKGGASGPALDAARPVESLLLRAVEYRDPDLEMPPKDKLPASDIALLQQWVAAGAPWPPSAVGGGAGSIGDAWSDPRNPIAQLWGGQRLDLWSLRPVRKPDPPALADAAPASSAIDRFIVARLQADGLKPAPAADRRTLIRRLSFDLLGLPPTPAEVEAFLHDSAPDAYARLVERLLASPHYGEHWARLWLDVVRYSDSNGFDWDEFRPAVWRYRDYVVRALNADKPFTQFVLEQLAGDELLAGPPTNADEQDALIATGYLRLGPQDNAAGLFDEQDRARAEWLADLTETTGSAFLGLTLSCCRCHDHKFDPLSQADHFRLRAFFAPIKYGDDVPLDLAPEQDAIRANHAEIDALVAALQRQKSELRAPVVSRLRNERRAQLTDDERALLDRPEDQVAEADQPRRRELQQKIEPADADVAAAFTPEETSRAAALEQQLRETQSRKRAFTRGWIATDEKGDIPATHVLYQGDHKAPRGAVEPGFLSALAPAPAAIAPAPNPHTHGRRLALARWLAAPDNPLTARVLVNRIWQAHFGRGLVATPNDFGLAGARPTHPELLDWLAASFVEQGWSLKALHREIVSSAVYRQASFRHDLDALAVDPRTVDADNQLLWRQNPRRLSAEQLRDALLATAGLLQTELGGPPVWPELPPEILQANPAFLDDNETKTKGWYPSPASLQGKRSLYLVQKRTVRVPLLETFDLPENSVSCACRSTSTVAPQALTLLNHPLALDAARALAEEIQATAGSVPSAQIEAAFAVVLQRSPTATERAACERFLANQPLAALCRGMLNLNEFLWID